VDLSKLNDKDFEALKAGKLQDISDEGFAYLQSQQSAPARVSQKEPGMLDYAMRGLNYAGGLGRAAVAGAMEPIVGKDLVSMEQALKGEVPGSAEIMEKAGVPNVALSDVLPQMYSKTGKGLALEKGGMFDPTARGAAGLVADIALDPTTYLAAPLKAAQLAKAGTTAGKALKLSEILINPIGQGVTAGVKGLGKVGTAMAGKLSQFTPEEASQYLRNAPAVKEAVQLLGNKESLDIAQEKAFQAINKMRDTLAEAGINADTEMTALLEGKNVTLNLNSIKRMAKELPEEAKNEVDAIIKRTEKNLEAYRPFQPEFLTEQSRQKGVEGLTNLPKSPEIIPSEVATKLEEQPSLFGFENLPEVTPPEFARTPQPPFFEELPKVSTAQIPEFMLSPLETSKIPAGMTKGTPGFSEYFPSETVPYSQLLQEPLPLPARSTLQELSTVSAPEARRLKQIAQKEAGYGKSVPVTAKGTPRYTEYEDFANMVNERLRNIEGAKALDDFMRQGIVAQEALEQGERAPLQFLKTQSEDTTATLARAARRTGNKEVFDLANQLSAARKIIGKGDYDDWVSRAGLRFAGRQSLKAIDKFGKTGVATQDMLKTVIKDPNVPSQIWLNMLRSKPKGEQQ
jgi:hypothetical protein